MRHYNKFLIATQDEIPKLGMQTVAVDCFHCGCKTIVPVPTDFVDWKLVAEDYRKAYEKLRVRFGEIISDINVMHAGPNPILDYMDNEWKVLIEDLRKDLEK